MNYSRQKGLLPTLLFLLGLGMHLTFIGGSLLFFVPAIVEAFREQPIGAAFLLSVELIVVMVAAVWSLPLIIGSFCVSAFPDIAITQNGIQYRVYGVVRTSIPWEEIVGIMELSRGYAAITLRRRGWILLNGMYTNKIYGDIVKSKYPVLLVSPGLERRDELLETISTKLHLLSR